MSDYRDDWKSGDYARAAGDEAKLMPIAVHTLMLLSVPSAGVCALLAAIVAYVARREPEDWRSSHYEFAIWTFWLSLAAVAIGTTLAIVGGVLSVILVGIPFFIVGILMVALVGVWVVVRSVLGLLYALRGEAYPRPRNLLF